MRGFDRAYYIITSEALETIGSDIIAVLKDGTLALNVIASECGIETDLCKAVLEVLRESGDIIEKRKDTYSLV